MNVSREGPVRPVIVVWRPRSPGQWITRRPAWCRWSMCTPRRGPSPTSISSPAGRSRLAT